VRLACHRRSWSDFARSPGAQGSPPRPVRRPVWSVSVLFCSNRSSNMIDWDMARLKAFDEDRAIDSAVDCFWARGYEATSVRDLADAMGIGGASLYNAYGDKRELFIRSLERYANRSMRERVARIEARLEPKQAIGAFLAEIIDRSVKDPDCKGCLLVNSALDV